VEAYEVADNAKIRDLALLRNCPNIQRATGMKGPAGYVSVEVLSFSTFAMYNEIRWDEWAAEWDEREVDKKCSEVLEKARILKKEAEQDKWLPSHGCACCEAFQKTRITRLFVRTTIPVMALLLCRPFFHFHLRSSNDPDSV